MKIDCCECNHIHDYESAQIKFGTFSCVSCGELLIFKYTEYMKEQYLTPRKMLIFMILSLVINVVSKSFVYGGLLFTLFLAYQVFMRIRSRVVCRSEILSVDKLKRNMQIGRLTLFTKPKFLILLGCFLTLYFWLMGEFKSNMVFETSIIVVALVIYRFVGLSILKKNKEAEVELIEKIDSRKAA